jgi:hypothetical protein
MGRKNNSKIVYSINMDDIQNVARQVISRDLSNNEIEMVIESLGDYIDWFQAVENSILKNRLK